MQACNPTNNTHRTTQSNTSREASSLECLREVTWPDLTVGRTLGSFAKILVKRCEISLQSVEKGEFALRSLSPECLTRSAFFFFFSFEFDPQTKRKDFLGEKLSFPA